MGEKKEEGRNMRVILFPLPLEGHTNPMIHLAHILYSKGFSITIIHTTHLNNSLLHPSNHPIFTFRSIIPDEAETSGGGGVIELITSLNRRCVEAFRKCVAELVADGGKIGCVITDAHWHFTQDVANEFGIRRIVLRTANISAFLGLLALPALRPNYLLPSSETSLEDPVPDFLHLRFKDLPAMKDQNPHLIDQLLSSIFIQTKASSAIIFNSFNDLELDPLLKCRQLFNRIPIFPLGPFHKQLPLTPQPHSSLSWLNSKTPKSVLYVSFGTLAAVDPHEFLEIAWGLANSTHPFLWVVRPGMVSGFEWLEPLPDGFEEMVGERGLIVKWAPQREVLAHPAIGGFWTHSGWNSTIESLCEGVPMLCYPCFGDQKANARYVTHVWRIGVMLGDKLERGEIEKGILKLMAEKENGEIMKRIKDLKEKAESCIEEGGSTFKSLENLVNFIL
ncbi:UDP-glycosyltransferase 76B1-like [Benincasa hispida]|uniref:UDP-glycosyltransferase 76B1-like n=1 Tax=Benincasa hispida TaxID=102211 RepID=UPI001901F006|nr:UDP-glycosyltransferase 76B1-like [Benincasa hispida]